MSPAGQHRTGFTRREGAVAPLRRPTPLAALALACLLLSGCRAFQPEAAIVNKPPETFITGAPSEHGGGYYRFHVYWHGRDEDGRVERFAWALTDGTRQDPNSDDDEEDQLFNPALNVQTLAIGHWTTRTDSVFNFTIDDGDSPSADRTLHLVALDDRGAFDRTPARLHFFANSLGNPQLEFFRLDGAEAVPLAPGAVDTVGYGRPYRLRWRGRSPNVRGWGAEALAAIDTLAPLDDGVLGYKWMVGGITGESCDPSREDCWHPRRFNEATGDSFSFFGADTTIFFANDGGDASLFRRLLPSGRVDLSVNALDIAGVEVGGAQRRLRFLVNYDPETLLLDGETDWAHPGDPESYPYYIHLSDPAQEHHPFSSGDRIPDRTYVVVKALARDDPRDVRLDADFRIGLSGFLHGARQNYTGGIFSFDSESSVLDLEPAWDAGVAGWYADTLGFLTAPATEFTVNAQSIDELERRDGTPAALSFSVGFPPCVQCLELLPKPGSATPAFDASTPCVEDPDATATHPCLAGTTELRVTLNGDGPGDLQYFGATNILVHRDTGFLKVSDAPAPGELGQNHVLPARLYKYSLLLHGSDDPRDAWPEPVRRLGAWRYQISSACDPFNLSQEGGGNDDIRLNTWGPPLPSTISTATGVWKLDVVVAVPSLLMQSGPAVFRAYLLAVVAGGRQDFADLVYAAVVRQFGESWVDAVAVDQTVCGLNPDRPARYNFFRKVRAPSNLPAGMTWRDCGLEDVFGAEIKEKMPLSLGAMASNGGQAVRKRFHLTLVTAVGELSCDAP